MTDYLASRESEVAGIMLSLWDEEKAIEIHMQAMEREAQERGLQKGIEQGMYEAALRFLKTGKITLEEVSIFFPELTTEDMANLKEEIL